MLVVDMYHQYHSRLTRGCLACGSRGDGLKWLARARARVLSEAGLPSLLCGESGSENRTFRVVAELGSLPLRDTPRKEEELNTLIAERPPSKRHDTQEEGAARSGRRSRK